MGASQTKLLTITLLLLVLGLISTTGSISAADEGITVGVQIDQKAPDFTLSLLDGNDEKLNLYEQMSKFDVVVLDFFIVSN